MVGEIRLSYAATCWDRDLNVHAVWKLISAQRVALLFTTEAYRKTSTDALLVLTVLNQKDLLEQAEYKFHGVTRLCQEIRVGYDSYKPADIEVSGIMSKISIHMHLPNVTSLTIRDSVGLTVYTDGSRTEGSTSLAYCVERNGVFIHGRQALLHLFNTVYQEELRSVCLAVD